MIQIESLADHLELVERIAGWHLAEWGQSDPSATLAGWTNGLRQRTKREQIPTTYVALAGNEPLGSVTLVERDMRTHLDLSPWLAGVYVIPERRHQGIGSLLVRHAVHQVAQMGVIGGEVKIFRNVEVKRAPFDLVIGHMRRFRCRHNKSPYKIDKPGGTTSSSLALYAAATRQNVSAIHYSRAWERYRESVFTCYSPPVIPSGRAMIQCGQGKRCLLPGVN